MASKKPKGPKSKWRSKKLTPNPLPDLKIINAWARELHRWAKIVTDEVRDYEASTVNSQNHIPDPPDPPFNGI